MKILLLPLVAAFLLPLSAHSADVRVTGSTLLAVDDGYNCVYQPLANVQIGVFRGGPVLPVNPSSDSQGKFEFGVPVGAPFRIVFYFDTKTVPELESLAGDAKRKHDFHVALLSVKAYRRLELTQGFPPLAKHLQRILDVIPKDSDPAKVIRKMLTELRE